MHKITNLGPTSGLMFKLLILALFFKARQSVPYCWKQYFCAVFTERIEVQRTPFCYRYGTPIHWRKGQQRTR